MKNGSFVEVRLPSELGFEEDSDEYSLALEWLR